MVNARGNHGLSCKRSAGKTLRNNKLNDFIYYGLLQAGLPSTKESAELLRTNVKRPDGLNNVPWQVGKSAVWGITVADKHADSYLVSTSMTVAAAESLLLSEKKPNMLNFQRYTTFVSLTFESLGSIGSKTTNFLKELGHRFILATDNPLETTYLFRRLFVSLQHFNAACVLGCFGGKQNDIDK